MYLLDGFDNGNILFREVPETNFPSSCESQPLIKFYCGISLNYMQIRSFILIKDIICDVSDQLRCITLTGMIGMSNDGTHFNKVIHFHPFTTYSNQFIILKYSKVLTERR